MDFMYDFLTFQHGNHDTNEKIEYYQNFIMTLLGELKTLREAMCHSCQKQCASSKATQSGNQSFSISKDSTIAMIPNKPFSNVDILASPLMPKTDVLWRTPVPGSSSPPINEKIASDSNSLSRNESDNPIFYAERKALTDSTIDVAFVRSFRHKDYVRCVCFSHDGRYMAVGTGLGYKECSIFIYEVESHKKYSELRECASQYGSYTRPPVASLCFSSNGRYLAAADFVGRVIIWDVPKKRIRSIFQSNESLRGIRFSPDGRLVALRTGTGLVILNMRDYTRKMASGGNYFDFSPNGCYIVTDLENIGLVILDLRTGRVVKRWYGNGMHLRDIKFTSDGRGLLCAYNNVTEQWDMSGAVPVLTRKLDVQSYPSSSAVSPDRRLLASSNELWDARSGKRQHTLQGHNHYLTSVNFSAAGNYLAMGDEGGFVSLWRCK